MRRILVVALIGLVAVAWSPGPPNQHKPDPDAGHSGPSEAPVTRAEVQAAIDKEATKRHDKIAEEEVATNEKIACFTALLVVVGGLSAFFSWRALIDANKGLRIVQRAWIAHLNINWIDDRPSVTLGNTGKSPALPVAWGVKAYIVPPPAPEVVWAELADASFGAIAPNQIVSMACKEGIPVSLDAYSCVISHMVYKDIFGETHISSDVWGLMPGTKDLILADIPGMDIAKYSKHT